MKLHKLVADIHHSNTAESLQHLLVKYRNVTKQRTRLEKLTDLSIYYKTNTATILCDFTDTLL